MMHRFLVSAVCLPVLCNSAVTAAAGFVDATATHVPAASELHALDAAFVDYELSVR